MERVNAILRCSTFVEALERTVELEVDRQFCKHGLEHFLDVARIAYILYLEANNDSEYRTPNSELTKELFYAAAILHDIGRARQYEDGTPHEQESAKIAAKLLPECGFDNYETAMILDAILSHRTASDGERTAFAQTIYRADKLSRNCTDCARSDVCDWPMKNERLEY